MNSSMLNVVS
jgi:DNA repair protein RAD50